MGFIVGKGFIVPCASPHSLQVVWPHDITCLPCAYHVALMAHGRKFSYACAFEFECVQTRFLCHVNSVLIYLTNITKVPFYMKLV